MKKRIFYMIIVITLLFPTLVSAEGSIFGGTTSVCGLDYFPEKIPEITSGLYNFVKLIVPVILVVMGMLDFTKAMMAKDDDAMKKNQKKFITRLIASVLIFLVMAVVQFVFSQINNTFAENGFVNCVNCLLNGDKYACAIIPTGNGIIDGIINTGDGISQNNSTNSNSQLNNSTNNNSENSNSNNSLAAEILEIATGCSGAINSTLTQISEKNCSEQSESNCLPINGCIWHMPTKKCLSNQYFK